MTGTTIKNLAGDYPGRVPPRVWIALAIASYVSVVIQVFPAIDLNFGDGYEVVAVARNLAVEGKFANPFHTLRTGPTAHVSPIYPLYLAAIFRVMGYSSAGLSTVVACLMAMHVLYPLLLFAASRKIFRSGAAGLTAAGVSILWPTFPPMIGEYVFGANAMLVCCLATIDWRKEAKISPVRTAAAGAFSGMLGLLTATAVTIAVPWFAFLHHRPGKNLRSLAPAAGLFLAGFAAAVSPWAIRNTISLGTPVLFRSNFGIELAFSNHGSAAATHSQNLENGTYTALHPNNNEVEAKKVAAIGEAAYNRHRLADALSWIGNHPYQFVAITLKRLFYYWFPYPGEYGSYSYRTWLLTGLAFGGLVLLFRNRDQFAWFFAASLFLFPLPIYLIQATLRYRLPCIWLEVILAGYLLASLAAAMQDSRMQSSPTASGIPGAAE